MPERSAVDVPTVHVDLSGIGDAIWNALMAHLDELGAAAWQGIRDHIGEIGSAIWTALSTWLYAAVRSFFLTIWNATLLTIPHELSDRFAPVTAMMPDPGAIAVAGLVLALA